MKSLFRLLSFVLLTSGLAYAQDYPTKPIRLIVGFAPGGGTDYVGRMIGQRLSDALGQPVVVENRPGASSMVANELVAKSAPDGYTLLVAAAGAMTIAPNINTNVGFDTFKDFEPIALVVTSPYLLTVNPSVPAKTLAEFTALAKASPGKLNFASSGTGGAPHLAGELYKRMARVDIVHVPYKGLAPAITDVLGGQVQAVFADINLVLKQIEAGKLKALAITGTQRFSALPDVPTMAEAGLPGYQAQTWYGLVAPAGTPAPIIKRLHAEVSKALALPEVRSQFATQGMLPASASATPADFAALIRADFDKWRKLIKEAGIKASG
ncbi:MAG: tripartite tricarboxylate transporter substrate binding protein [Betaproteobacteria bacterium]|nr:MAG: tripartite tricarboxylate transporter substrate binding protein [Betaproteobacteria bacterium]